jgi:hypothetical protein
MWRIRQWRNAHNSDIHHGDLCTVTNITFNTPSTYKQNGSGSILTNCQSSGAREEKVVFLGSLTVPDTASCHQRMNANGNRTK